MEQLRGEVETAFLTYGYVVNSDNQLQGVVVMRDLLLAESTTLVDDVMLREPYCLHPDDTVLEAMKEVIHRHYPVYPVCDEEKHLLGLVRGYTLFAEEVMQITAQPGRMVGVVEEERVSTSWGKSLRFRHPWLQLNLVTAFVAAFVVGMFEATIDQIVALAVFLPVLGRAIRQYRLSGFSGDVARHDIRGTFRSKYKKFSDKRSLPGVIEWLVSGNSGGRGDVCLCQHFVCE